MPGLHKANAVIKGGKNISIKGCGHQTLVVPEKREQPIFKIVDSQFITIEGVNITTFEGIAILIEEETDGKLKEIEISSNKIIALKNAVYIWNGEKIKIRKNKIRMLDRDNGDTAIFMMGESSIIENNEISVLPAEKLSPPKEIIHTGMAVPDLSLPDTDVESIYNLGEVGGRIWELIDGKRRLEEIRDVIVEEFEVTPEKAEADLVRFMEQLEGIEAVKEL